MEETQVSRFRVWMMAIRPKTLPAAMAPVLVGTAFALKRGEFNFLPFLATLLGALLLQIAANLSNDYFDFLSGYDTTDRIGPTRVAASGLMDINELRNGLIVNILLALIIGLYLVYEGGIYILIIGVLSIVFALAYSGGPFPLASNGLGDLFVFIFFGIIAVNGSYFIQSKTLESQVFLGSIPIGLIITAILVVNNYRDIETDRNTGKKTLAVFMGEKMTKVYFVSLFVVSYLIPLFFSFRSNYNLMVLLPLISIPLAIKQITSLYSTATGSQLNTTLSGTAQLALIYSLLFSVGIIYS